VSPALFRAGKCHTERMRGLPAAVLVLALSCFGLCSCSMASNDTGASNPQQSPAEKTVNSAVVPPGAVLLTDYTGILREFPLPSCTHLTNAVHYWQASHGIGLVTSYLVSHPAASTSVGPEGVGEVHGNPAGYHYLNERRSSTTSLLYRYLSAGNGKVTIRIDAFVLSKNGKCHPSPA
jgi:hypothetical protein